MESSVKPIPTSPAANAIKPATMVAILLNILALRSNKAGIPAPKPTNTKIPKPTNVHKKAWNGLVEYTTVPIRFSFERNDNHTIIKPNINQDIFINKHLKPAYNQSR